jgi:hypothetical protein
MRPGFLPSVELELALRADTHAAAAANARAGAASQPVRGEAG